jgi:oxaloacetate decarboxylase gamma subunit
MQNELIDEGLTLMLAGMGTVFVFLTVLVFMMTLMSRLIMRFQSPSDAAGPSDDEVAAITAAVTQHRRK